MRKQDCDKYDVCIYDESENCINRCTSPKCYENVYQPNRLEPGQRDKLLERQFQDCMKNEDKRLKDEFYKKT